jgi:hypothetical protein
VHGGRQTFVLVRDGALEGVLVLLPLFLEGVLEVVAHDLCEGGGTSSGLICRLRGGLFFSTI